MFRTTSVLAFLALTACGGPVAQPTSGPYRLSDGSTTMDLAVWERDNAEATARFKAPTKAIQRTVTVSVQKMAVYQSAVADTLRDPESARFRNVRVVRKADGSDALCGELNAKNVYGGYVGYAPFYAPMVTAKDKAIAELWWSPSVGLEAILEKCGQG